MSLPLPHVLAGRYVLRRRLGFGTSAVTYRAIDRRTGRAVAVKVLHEHLAADHEVAARFQREAETAATFQHRSVVKVLDHGRDGDLLFTVMELVEGGNLKEFARARAPLPIPHALALIQGVLQGLEEIHRHQVVHRDVKPENILLTRDGTPKLTDFGIARATDTHHLTRTGLTLGTAAYMAPEQALGEPVGPAADLYAAGIVLFQLLTGRLPFPGDDPLQVMYRQVHDAPPSPRDLNPAIPETLSAVMLRALDKDPAQRFASAHEMWRALAQAWSAAPATLGASATDTLAVRPFSSVPGAARRGWRGLPAERLAAGMASVAAVLLIATLGITGLTRGLTTEADTSSSPMIATPLVTPRAGSDPHGSSATIAYPTDTWSQPTGTATAAPTAVATDSSEPDVTPEPTAAPAPSTELAAQPINPNASPPVIHEEPEQATQPNDSHPHAKPAPKPAPAAKPKHAAQQQSASGKGADAQQHPSQGHGKGHD